MLQAWNGLERVCLSCVYLDFSTYVKWGVIIWLWLCIILKRVTERGEKEEILEDEGDERVKNVSGQMEEWGVKLLHSQ